jgi:hypothetical protein
MDIHPASSTVPLGSSSSSSALKVEPAKKRHNVADSPIAKGGKVAQGGVFKPKQSKSRNGKPWRSME